MNRRLVLAARLAALASLTLAVTSCDRPTKPVEKPSPSVSVAKVENEAPQLISRLAALNVTNGVVADAPAAEWKQNLTNLVARGPAAVAAIEEFFLRNVDLNFEPGGNDRGLGFPSLRLGVLSALTKIGGSNSLAVAQKIFRMTADPLELAELARMIELAEPGKHRAEFASAAHETLALAASGKWDGRDVAPLFELLQTFGGTNDIAELERYGNTWFAYTAISIARWPGGDGIPTLIKLAQNADGRITLGREFYLRMLTDRALSSPAAAEALVAEVRRNSIDVGVWPGLGRTLMGFSLHLPEHRATQAGAVASPPDPRTYHLAFGNQNFIESSLPDDAPARDLGSRINLIDRLLETTTNPAAIDAFEFARVALSARLSKPK